MRPGERRSGAYAHEPAHTRLRTRTHTHECWVFTRWRRMWWHGKGGKGMAGCEGERETPSILGDDGPVGELAFLLVLSHVAHTLGRSFVSQCYTTNRPHKVPVSILLAHYRRRSLTGTAADRSRRAWREERVSPQTCKWPKQVRLQCLLVRGEVKELRNDRVRGCRVSSQRDWEWSQVRQRQDAQVPSLALISAETWDAAGRSAERGRSSSLLLSHPQRSPAFPISTNLARMTRQDWLMPGLRHARQVVQNAAVHEHDRPCHHLGSRR